jgi:hypothetical protein
MAIDQRDQIFEMRRQDPPISWSVIAGELGISRSKAQRLFNRRAPSSPAAGAAPRLSVDLGLPPTAPGLELDPEVAQRRRQIELRRLDLAESRLALDAIEQQQRVAVMQGRPGGGDSAMVTMLFGEMARLRDRIDSGIANREPASTITDELTKMVQLQKMVAALVPPPAAAPNSAVDLEWRLMNRRLDLEDQRLQRERDKELGLRQREVDSANMRNDAIAKFVESFGPMLSQVAQKYLEDRIPARAGAAAGQPALPAGDASRPAAAAADEVRGECPVCHTPIGKTTVEPEKCPGCGTLITIAGGQIVLAGAPAPEAAESNGRSRAMQPVAS